MYDDNVKQMDLQVFISMLPNLDIFTNNVLKHTLLICYEGINVHPFMTKNNTMTCINSKDR
jgi:hypothetical protein